MAFGNATKGYVLKHSGGGGGGGTTNYSELSNKPQINGVTLDGNKTSEELHITSGGGGLTITELSGTTFNKNDYKAVIVAVEYVEYPTYMRNTVIYPTSIFDRSFNIVENVTESKTIGLTFTVSDNNVTVNKYWGDGNIYKIYGVN